MWLFAVQNNLVQSLCATIQFIHCLRRPTLAPFPLLLSHLSSNWLVPVNRRFKIRWAGLAMFNVSTDHCHSTHMTEKTKQMLLCIIPTFTFGIHRTWMPPCVWSTLHFAHSKINIIELPAESELHCNSRISLQHFCPKVNKALKWRKILIQYEPCSSIYFTNF